MYQSSVGPSVGNQPINLANLRPQVGSSGFQVGNSPSVGSSGFQVGNSPSVGSVPDLWFTGRKLVPNPEEGWLNLNTGKYLKSPTGWAIKGLRFVGDLSHLADFWVANLNKLATLLPPGSTFESAVYQPGEDVLVLAQEAARSVQLCFRGTAGSIIPPAKTTDVKSLTPDQLNSLCLFNFGGLFLESRVVHVIDGDTIDVVAYIPLIDLGSARIPLHGKSKDPQTSALVSGNYQTTGFFAKIRLRTYAYDAIEKDKPAGQQAKQLFTQKLESLGNLVWCQFLEDEKYGRTLAILYEDQARTRSLNDYLVNLGKQLGVRLAYPYTGGTKDQ